MIFFRKKKETTPGLELMPKCARDKLIGGMVKFVNTDTFGDRVYANTVNYALYRILRGEDIQQTYTTLPVSFVKKYLNIGKKLEEYNESIIKNILGKDLNDIFFGEDKYAVNIVSAVLEVREVTVKRYTDEIEDFISGLKKHGLKYINMYFDAGLSDTELEEYFGAYYKMLVSSDGEKQMQALAETLLKLYSLGSLDRNGLKMYADALRFLTVYRVGIILKLKIKAGFLPYFNTYLVNGKDTLGKKVKVGYAEHKKLKKAEIYILPLKHLETREQITRYVTRTFIMNELRTSFKTILVSAMIVPVSILIGYKIADELVYAFKLYMFYDASKLIDTVREYIMMCKWRRMGYKVFVDEYNMYGVIIYLEPEEAPGQYMFMIIGNPLYTPFWDKEEEKIGNIVIGLVGVQVYGLQETWESYNAISAVADKHISTLVQPDDAVKTVKEFIGSEFENEIGYYDFLEMFVSGFAGFPRYSVLARKLRLESPYARHGYAGRRKESEINVVGAMVRAVSGEGEKPKPREDNLSSLVEERLRELGLL